MNDKTEQRARELLAAEWRKSGHDSIAFGLLQPKLLTQENPAIRAIITALNESAHKPEAQAAGLDEMLEVVAKYVGRTSNIFGYIRDDLKGTFKTALSAPASPAAQQPVCDCENPKPANGAALVSMECPIHNDNPKQPAVVGDDVIEAEAKRMFAEQADPLAADWDIQWEPTRQHWRSQARAALTSAATPGDVECHKLDTPTQVRFYEQDFYVLSNFSAFSLRWDGFRFDTSEAAYHYEKFKFFAPGVCDAIIVAASAHAAFKIAEQHKDLRNPEWEGIRLSVMRAILREKAAQHEYVRRKLLATGDRELVEDSWRDDFWGWGPNRDGKNWLGRLWMEVRAELRAAQKEGNGDG